MNKEQYKQYVDKRTNGSKTARDTIRAFFVGGCICMLAQGLSELYNSIGIKAETVKTMVPITLIFISSLLAGLGVFDKIAKFSGAGTLVPITGFANAVTSASIDSKSEGFVLGVGAKMFTIAGPVIVYGTAASAVYGVIYWICKMI